MQAIWRKSQKLGLQCAYQNIPIVRKIIKELIALALLPADAIPRGLQVTICPMHLLVNARNIICNFDFFLSCP